MTTVTQSHGRIVLHACEMVPLYNRYESPHQTLMRVCCQRGMPFMALGDSRADSLMFAPHPDYNFDRIDYHDGTTVFNWWRASPSY